MAFNFSLISANSSSLERPSRINGASISEVFTPKECSSNSARPVLRPTVCISLMLSSSVSTNRPILSDSSKEIPGVVFTVIVKDPSLKGGRKFRPKVKNITIADINRSPVAANTFFWFSNAQCRLFSYQYFKVKTMRGSFSSLSPFVFPNK